MSDAFPSLGDPDTNLRRHPVPELSPLAEKIVGGIGVVGGVFFAVFFMTFGVLGIVIVSALFG